MLDTSEIYKTFFKQPDYDGLMNVGWKANVFYKTGEPKIMYLRSKDKYSPFLKLVNSQNKVFYLRVALSFPRWLFGSNIHLPVGRDIRQGFDYLSEFVGDHSGIKFDAKLEKVRRVDYTIDYKIGQENVLRLLEQYKKFSLPKYQTDIINQSTIYIQNKGKVKNNKYCIYSKFLERKNKKGTQDEIEMSDGIIRFERSIKNDAVNRLSKSLKVLNEARRLLSDDSALEVIRSMKNKLRLQAMLDSETEMTPKELIFCNSKSPFTALGWFEMFKEHGQNLEDLPYINVSPRTVRRYRKYLQEMGVL